MRKMSRASVIAVFACLAVALLALGGAEGFPSKIGPDGECAECHTLSLDEAGSLIRSMNPDITVSGVSMGPVEGMWEVVIEARGKKGIAYIDFSKEHIITGSILKISTKENLTNLKLYDLSKVDLSVVPLEEALYLGKREAKNKVIVFDDPD
jgi:thiol:disulfide interchange protein DsbC